jgi:hypothetical protein
MGKIANPEQFDVARSALFDYFKFQISTLQYLSAGSLSAASIFLINLDEIKNHYVILSSFSIFYFWFALYYSIFSARKFGVYCGKYLSWQLCITGTTTVPEILQPLTFNDANEIMKKDVQIKQDEISDYIDKSREMLLWGIAFLGFIFILHKLL